MKSEALLLPALFCSLAGAASAQAPTFTLLPGSSAAWDASVSCGTVVAGTTGAGAFRYTATDGVVNIGGDPSNGSGEVRISRSGTTIAGDTVGSDGRYRASIWNGGTSWTQLPGLGGSSGTSETGTYGVSGDGSVVVGLGWINAGTAHAFRWTQATGDRKSVV